MPTSRMDFESYICMNIDHVCGNAINQEAIKALRPFGGRSATLSWNVKNLLLGEDRLIPEVPRQLHIRCISKPPLDLQGVNV
ncbi:UNVERIFIED_CONTAM: hypothetical protein Slati_2743200 [Sesamum latifolium]|uniref:Uncharacterized protein n=1 Tax=Sesamum latifolium TaxID=2727402 RepID=A0AAW2VWQ6_9LAMI